MSTRLSQLPPERIFSRAVTTMHELRAYPTWQASLEDAEVDPAPLSVRIHTVAGRTAPQLYDYYIVTVRRRGGVTARFAHRADTGDFLEAEAVRTAAVLLPAYADHIDGLVSRLADGNPPTADVVWYPCVQSDSRFLPFWMFPINGRQVYVRADGVIFDRLTFTMKG
jgi:hypothetical protein